MHTSCENIYIGLNLYIGLSLYIYIYCESTYINNEKVFNKNCVIIGLPQKGQKQVTDFQCNVPTSLVHVLHWRSVTCFCPFCGSPNYPVFVKKTFSLLVCTVFFTYTVSTLHELGHL